jgi:thiol-disulfide isomerase/thioredoxin
MKKSLNILLLTIACALSANAQNVSVINGIWERGTPEQIRLFAIENGNLHEIATSRVGANGEFLFAFSPQQEGFFSIGTSTNSAADRHTFYFKPGDQLNVRVFREGFELTGENTPENTVMAQWHNFVQPLELMTDLRRRDSSSNYRYFFPLLIEKEAELQNFPRANTPNATFNNLFERYKEADFLALAIAFTRLPQRVGSHPSPEDFPDFYRNVNLERLTQDTFLLGFPDGITLLSRAYSELLNATVSPEARAQFMQNPAATLLPDTRIIDPTIRGELALLFARHNRTMAGFNEYMARWGDYMITDSQKERAREIQIALFQTDAGSEAIDFTFPDIDGNRVSLSDFKGKVVYIDVWATWCAPCRREIPHLRQLAADFQDNENIVFMSVSVDRTRDKNNWKTYVGEHKQFGVQLFAGDDAEKYLMTPYQIGGIPRFILIGKDGKIILADAPRPSSPEIRAILKEALSR